ncbi:MAG TPA: hypothetical protein VFL83_10730 [Anaeromyxobacter sp.]|nr:hypothetical protein [Anaeromyxobacter sp.]
MLVWIGTLFVIAWAIGLATVRDVGWYVHLPLLVGSAAVFFGLVRRRRATEP